MFFFMTKVVSNKELGFIRRQRLAEKKPEIPCPNIRLENMTAGVWLQYGEDGGGGGRRVGGGRRNSLCAGWTNVLSPLDQNRTGIYQNIPFKASFNSFTNNPLHH